MSEVVCEVMNNIKQLKPTISDTECEEIAKTLCSKIIWDGSAVQKGLFWITRLYLIKHNYI